MEKFVDLDGMSVESLFNKLRDQGIGRAEAGTLVSGWLFKNFGSTRRVFNFAESAPDPAAGLPSPFQQQFSHTHWIDGQSLVQAGETPSEEGFNKRLDNISKDIEALGAQVAQLSLCLQETRRLMLTMFTEVKGELNLINGDINTLMSKREERVFEPPRPYDGLIDFGRFVGPTKFSGKDMSLWQTSQGYIMLPPVESIKTGPVIDNRATAAGELAKYIAENSDVVTSFPGNVTKKDFVTKFGNSRLSDGRKVVDVMDVIPDEHSPYATIDAMLADLSDKNATVIRATAGGTAAVAGTLGLEALGSDMSSVKISSMSGMSPEVAKALSDRGVDTVDRLAALPADKSTAILKDAGLSSSAGEVSALRHTAMTLRAIGRTKKLNP